MIYYTIYRETRRLHNANIVSSTYIRCVETTCSAFFVIQSGSGVCGMHVVCFVATGYGLTVRCILFGVLILVILSALGSPGFNC